MIPLSIATAAYLAQLSLLLWVAYSDAQFHRYTAAKAVTSAGFLLVALLARLIGPRTMGPRFWLLFSAMVLCADVYKRQGPGRRPRRTEETCEAVGCPPSKKSHRCSS